MDEQDAGGRQRANKNTTTTLLHQKLHEIGWKKAFLASKLKGLTNKDLEWETTGYWVFTYAQQFFCETDNTLTFTERLKHCGLNKKKTREYLRVASPFLGDGPYTDAQLFDVVIEYALGYDKPIGAPGAPYLFEHDTENEWFKATETGGRYACNYNYNPESQAAPGTLLIPNSFY